MGQLGDMLVMIGEERREEAEPGFYRERCPACVGTGWSYNVGRCPNCAGTTYVLVERAA